MSRRTYTPAERQRAERVKVREIIQARVAEIEALAIKLQLDEMSAVMAACGTIRHAAAGYVMRLVRTDDGQDARKAIEP